MRRRSLACVLLVLAASACGSNGEQTQPPGATPPDDGPSGPRWVQISSEGPSARTDHALAASGTSVFLFGGRSGGTELGDLWRLDIDSGEWSEVDVSGEAPGARFGPAFEPQPDGSLVLFGGENRSNRTFFNDVWRLDPDSEQWTKLAEGGPAPRYGAGSAIDGSGALYVTHGFTSSGRFDDTWSFAGEEFTDRSAPGERPIERCLLQASYHNSGLLIFGGQSNVELFLDDLWRLDLDAGEWQRLEPDARPSGRNLYAAAQVGGAWWLHGGRGPEGPLGDLWRFDLESSVFESVELEDGPGARSGHAATPLESGLVLFGGEGPEGALSDTWHLAL